jgi:hypothetical protein
MNPPDPHVPLLLGPDPQGPPIPAPLPPEVRSYESLYASQAATAFPDGYGPYMSLFAHDSTMTSAALLAHIAGNVTIPQGYLQICTPTEGHPLVFCLHHPSRFFPDLTGPPTQWDNMYFASLGDVTDTIITMTYFPTTAFELTDPVHVHSAFDCAQLLTTDPATQFLPPPIAGTELRCRRIMALPARYLPLFMDGAGMPLRAAWLLLYPVLNTAEPPTQQLTSAQSFRFMNSPGATRPLIHHRLSILKADLPALFHQQPLPHVPTPPAQGLTDGTNEALQSMAAARLRSSEVQLARQAKTVSNTTPSGKWLERLAPHDLPRP